MSLKGEKILLLRKQKSRSFERSKIPPNNKAEYKISGHYLIISVILFCKQLSLRAY